MYDILMSPYRAHVAVLLMFHPSGVFLMSLKLRQNLAHLDLPLLKAPPPHQHHQAVIMPMQQQQAKGVQQEHQQQEQEEPLIKVILVKEGVVV